MTTKKKKWIVKGMQNLTACDTFNEDTHQGSTQRELWREVFYCYDHAISCYERQKAALHFASVGGEYVTFPVEHTDFFDREDWDDQHWPERTTTE